MAGSVHTADAFSPNASDARTVRQIARGLRQCWPDVTGQKLLGLGATADWLPQWEHQVHLTVDARTARFRGGEGNRICVVSETCLPFEDLSFDRILVAGVLEHSDQQRDILRSLWRVLKDDGRMIIIVPARYAPRRMLKRPFSFQEQTFSLRQFRTLLQQSMFCVEHLRSAGYPAPGKGLFAADREESLYEAAAARFLPGMGDVLIAEVVKSLWGGVPEGASGGILAKARRVIVPG